MPPDPNQRSFDQRLQTEVLRSEHLRASIIGGCCVVFCAIIAVLPAVRPGLAESRRVVLPALALMVVYELGIRAWLGRIIRQGRTPASALWTYANTAVELTVPTAVIYQTAGYLGPLEAALTPPSLVCFLVITLTTLRMNPWLSLYAGALAAAEYLGVVAALGLLHRADPSQPLLQSTVFFVGRAVVLVISGAAAAFIAAEIRRRCVAVLTHADERNRLLRFFPPSTIERVLDPAGAGLQTIDTEVTALFCDLTGFTDLSARKTPREVVALLNAYFPAVVSVAFRFEGTLEKYIGDALLAVWGAPIRRDDDADRAVLAALEMQRAVGRLNAAGGLSERLAVHIGLNTGPVAAGNIGTPEYVQYATIGDATNVAARVCAAAREGEVVIAASTYARLRGRYAIEPLGLVALKGKDEPVELYRVVGEAEPVAPLRG